MTTEKQRTLGSGGDAFIPLLVLDGGNRFVNGFSANGRPWQIPAVVKELEDWEDAGWNDHSTLIQVGDRRWIVGELARQLGGQPVFLGEKSELSWLLVAAALRPPTSSGVVGINELRLLCTDSRSKAFQDAVSHIQSLEWAGKERRFQRNGKPVSLVAIRSVTLVDEGLPPWRYAKARGWWKFPKMNNAVLDIGGGDSTGRIITPSGLIDRKADIIIPGTARLASLIASAIQQHWQHTPPLAAIMDAIADGTFTLQGPNLQSLSFRDAFDRALPRWIEEIKAEIRAKWMQDATRWNNLGEVLMVGGSAPLLELLEEATGGRFRVATHPEIPNFSQLINAYGLLEG